MTGSAKSGKTPKAVLEGLSEVKRKIITELWPMKWMKSSRLLEFTGQSNFQRRIRELREEHGFDIESKIIGGEWRYRLKSHVPRMAERRRKYPARIQKETVLKRDGNRCNICRFEPPNGKIGGFLQYDHKVPFERGGSTTVPNLQLLCIRCNVMKRRTCQLCELETCDGCPYAYPEKFPSRIVIEKE